MPTDSNGRKCGVDNGVIDKPYLLFFNLEKCIDPRVPLFGCKTPQVCVRQCPTTSFLYDPFRCNDSTFSQIRSQLVCQMGVAVNQIKSCADIAERIRVGDCARWYLPSTPCKLHPSLYITPDNYILTYFWVHHFLFN